MPDFTTIAEVQAEIDETSKDLESFVRAREIIRLRVVEVKDSQSKLTPLPYWSGTDAVLGSLDLAIHAMERTLEELRSLLQMAQSQVRESPFKVIDGGRDGSEG